jgi:acetyl-CoA synthetase
MQTGLVAAATAIGVPDAVKGAAIVCVCIPASGVNDSDDVRARLSDAVTSGLGAPFRPKEVVLVSDLPMTRNLKIMRRTVRATYMGADPGDLSSLLNPEAVEELKLKVFAAD